MYNIIELFNSNSFWYCFCEKVPGCRSKHGRRDWCLVCMLHQNEEFSLEYLNTIKKIPVKLAIFRNKVYDRLMQIFNYGETISELWNGDFS